MKHDWDRLIGHPLPPDFPFELLIAVHDIARQRTDSPSWEFCAGAENGIAYRSMAIAQSDESFRASVARPYTMAERAEQEQSLFGFFSATISAVETLYFALYAVAAIFDPLNFEYLPTFPRRVVPLVVSAKFRNLANTLPVAPPGDSPAEELIRAATRLSASLDGLLSDPTYEGCLETRNILSHRAAPGRRLDGTASPMVWKLGPHGAEEDAISPRLTESRRAWFMAQASSVLNHAVSFLRSWPPCEAEAKLAERTGGTGY
jgi:hypothetical protein